MSTPSKRRKKNDGQPARGLDYFFGKQAQAKLPPKDEPKIEAQETELKHDDLDHDVLSDEALARKLQAEWDEADRAASASAPTPSPSKAAPTTEALEAAALPEHIKQETDMKEETPTPISAPAAAPINPFAGLGKKNTLSLQSATADEDTITYDIPFDQSPLTFDPQKYIPELKKQWVTDNGHATYALLTHCFVMVNSTQSRIKIVDTLVNTLRVIIEGDPQSLLSAVWLATNSISPPYIDMELGLGGSAISKALKKVCGLDSPGLKKLFDKYGDAGDVAFEAKKRQSLTLRKPKPLTIKAVFESLVKIANAKGHGSVEVKQRLVERLVQDSRGAEESRYVVRTLVQHVSSLDFIKRTISDSGAASYWCRKDDHAYCTVSSVSLIKTTRRGLPDKRQTWIGQALETTTGRSILSCRGDCQGLLCSSTKLCEHTTSLTC